MQRMLAGLAAACLVLPALRGGPAEKEPLLKPFNELQPPSLTLEQLGDDSQAGKLLRQAGLL